jgi:hypothetical protein
MVVAVVLGSVQRNHSMTFSSILSALERRVRAGYSVSASAKCNGPYDWYWRSDEAFEPRVCSRVDS